MNAAVSRGEQHMHAQNGMAKLSPSLKTLLKATRTLKTKGTLGDTVTNLATDSRRVVPGSLFFALPGLRVDGNTFVEEAIGRGAVGIVTEKLRKGVCPVPVIQVENVRRALAEIAAEFYGHPEQALRNCGVTGTNGKTTVTMLAQHLLSEEKPVGLIGTVRYDVGPRTFPAFRTTPEALDCFALLDQMRQSACEQVMMEVSSHGIDQERIWGIPFETAVFTNLTQDHLDYHKDFESYYRAKAQLFHGVGARAPKISIINIDDTWGERLAREVVPNTEVWSFGRHVEARFRIQIETLNAAGGVFVLHDTVSGDDLTVETSLLGEYNVYNLVAAILIAKSLGKSSEEILRRIETLPDVPGRMERISSKEGVNVLVDYAHTDDAIHNALKMLRSITEGKIHIVFGCGGDRDRTKRAKMVEAAEPLADTLVLTSDNPRSEPIEQIFSDMRSGLKTQDPARIKIIRDRREAISAALRIAEKGDCVLVAGKGHENFQEIEGALIPFDDRQVVKELIQIHELRSV
ncbi:MAG: UDP-N-acetylmuramoyl-L-alanyl-D-glutamate--2,6-diaminopimelate ligase [Opitutales bacterium]